MGKRNTKAKRSLGSLPKGLVRRNGGTVDPGNPFEITARQKRPKHQVHNRPLSKPKSTKHALESLQRRQTHLRASLKSSNKVNQFVDRRIGQYDPTMTQDDQMLARLVKERTRQSKKANKFRLDGGDAADDDNGGGVLSLTHKGRTLDPNKSEALYSDDDDDDGDRGNLEAVDTELHFGGSGMGGGGSSSSSGGGGGGDRYTQVNPYGRQTPDASDLAAVYGQRKTELDDLIARRKAIKAEKMASKETQVDTFERMDEEFGTLSELLKYRKNEVRPKVPPKPTEEDEEMKEWNLSVREMMIKPKRRATDRIKTPEELAKEEAERLHQLETRRLARMNGDFDEDDFSDISIGGGAKKRKKRKERQQKHRNPEELSDSEDEKEDDDGLEMRFTADGIRYFDKYGNMVEKRDHGNEENDDSGDDDDDDDQSDASADKEENDEDDHKYDEPLSEGMRVRGHYRIEEQYNGQGEWFEGEIAKVRPQKDGTFKYDVQYDDGDFEENMIEENVRPIKTSPPKNEKGTKEEKIDDQLQIKQKLAKEKARNEIPFVFEVPTTLEALEELIIKYAQTGADASIIVERIHAANSVRLDHRNGQKMQNFCDVLLRRFMALGDNVLLSGDGGPILCRSAQLNCITKVLFKIAQESPEIAGAVWSRRIGILHSAHEKRLRDSAFVHDSEDEIWSPWPSTGTFLLLRVVGHIFPVTDKRHHVVTPTMLLLAQMVSQTPVSSEVDLTIGILCSALLLEYSKEAKRVVPEALSFIASTIRLFASEKGRFTNPALDAAYEQEFCQSLRRRLPKYKHDKDVGLPRLKLENDFIMSCSPEVPVAVLSTCLGLVEQCASALKGAFSVASESELLYEASSAILCLHCKSMPVFIQKKIAKTASVVAEVCQPLRPPLARRSGPTAAECGIKALAPRMEDPSRYSMSRDKGKKSVQAAIDRTRREYKREHKAISRELRMDGAFIETERRSEQTRKDDKARAKRQKNFAWLEGEQASMNQQVRQGGGLLKGGGMGLARAKAATGRMGIKKGGKF